MHRNNVTSQLQITRSGFRFDRITQHFFKQVTFKNVSGSSIAGPFSLVLDNVDSETTLVNSTGKTTKLAPLGSLFINVNAGLNAYKTLGPQQSAFVVLEFSNPPGTGDFYSTRVLAGTVER
jgi:hypothetical protein